MASPVVAGDLVLGSCGFAGGQKHLVAVRPYDSFADGEPSVMPFCGIPLKYRSASGAPGRPLAIEPTAGTPFGVDEPPPVKTTISTTATAVW